VIERLAAAPADDGLVIHDIWLLRPRAMLARLSRLSGSLHLREVLGEQTYESLARKGETMTTAATATYAYDQIGQARAELKTVSE
jgi:hypothetical protein